MSFFTLVGVELTKTRRSRILFIMAAAAMMLWMPSVLNADSNFKMQDVGITPENSFFIQGFLAMTWFIFPAAMVVMTVLLTMTERQNGGLRKMLSLPVRPVWLCLAKFMVLLILAAMQILFCVGMYFFSALAASRLQNYRFCLSPLFVFKQAGLIFLASVPMLAVFWLLAVCIKTPIFSIGAGLASLVPSVLVINTKIWFAYPMAYPFFVVTAEYGKLAANLDTAQPALFPWLPTALGITALCLLISCLRFGQTERN